MGFAKSTDQNLSLLKGLDRLKIEGFPLLIGPSRKRFIREVLNLPSIDNSIWGTSAVICKCVQMKVDLVRVHDVAQVKHSITMSEQLW